MDSSFLDQIAAMASPLDDVFDVDIDHCGPTLRHLPIWTHCGQRIDLVACTLGLLTLGLREIIDDAELTWYGGDAAAWEHDDVLEIQASSHDHGSSWL